MVSRTAEPALYKDKIEVSLDGRQIFYLFFGGAVVACLVFVLGVMIGRRLEARAHVDRAAATSATRDPLAALDRLAEGKGELTYPAALAEDAMPVTAVDRTLQAGPPAGPDKSRASAPERAAAADDAKARSSGAAAPPMPAETPTETEAAPAARRPEVQAPVARPEAPTPASRPEAVPAARPEAPVKPGKGKFTLQLSAFQSQAEAEAFQAQMKASGYAAYVVSAEVEGKGTYYRVRVGSYGSYDDALAAKAEFERKVPRIAYVTRL